ncbi:MAG TPA: hypothetical protein P5550_00395 [Bacteroidales bacterium]|nr:hypothetical protein [Bacteroidales bacterium]
MALAVMLGSCSAAHSSYAGYDDVYYTPSDAPAQAPAAPVVTQYQVAPDQATYTVKEPAVAADPNYAGHDEDLVYGNNTYREDPEYVPDQSQEYQGGTYTDPEGNVYVTNNYYGGDFRYDDYYDYAYASRIRRFHNYGFNSYYHDYYTNQYWYNNDPWCYGTSIYMGYDFWYPSYYYYGYPGWSVGFGWGWGGLYLGWPYHGVFHPYHSWGYNGYWGWGSYSHGYWNGYWDGYYSGYWDGGYYGHYGNYYYNSHDNNAYYGPRNPRTSTSGTSRDGRSPRSLGERYEASMANQGVVTPRAERMLAMESSGPRQGNTVRTNETSTGNATGRAAAEPIQGRSNAQTSGNVRETGNRDASAAGATNQASAEMQPAGSVRENTARSEENRTASGSRVQERPAGVQGQTDGNAGGVTRPAERPAQTNRTENTTRYNYESREDQGATKYSRPDASVYQRYQKPKVYTSPTYTRPQSSQEYTSPGAKDPRNYTRPATTEGQRREYTRPGNTEQRSTPDYSRPAEQQQSAPSRSYTPPSRQSEPSYTPPTRTYSPPAQRENRSYTPSRSYEAPSRSSGNSSSSSKSNSSYTPSRSSGSSGSSGSSRSSGNSRSSSSSSGSSSGRSGKR